MKHLKNGLKQIKKKKRYCITWIFFFSYDWNGPKFQRYDNTMSFRPCKTFDIACTTICHRNIGYIYFLLWWVWLLLYFLSSYLLYNIVHILLVAWFTRAIYLIIQADNLRQQTLHQLRRILTVRQAARCFLVIGEYYGRLRALSSLWTSRPRE